MTEMKGQQPLFDLPAATPAQRHSQTSKDAAKSMRPTAMSVRDQVYEFIHRRGDYGATDAEIMLAFPSKSPNTIRPRRVDLVDAGLVVDSGKTRMTIWKRKAVVWRVK